MSQITLEQANQIIAGAFSRGREARFRSLSVAVVDAGGHLIAFQRGDGASFARAQIAIGKASGALALGVSSRKIAEMAIERPSFIGAFASALPSPMIPAAGGVILVDRKGALIGAVGVTGDTSDNDELAALCGIAAAGLVAQA